MNSPHMFGSRVGSLLLMLGLSTGLACSNAGADRAIESGSVEDPASENTPATMKELTLAVSGMTWVQGCAPRVKAALESVPGVRKAIVSFEKKEAVVTYDSSKATLEQMQAALKKSNYSGKLKEEAAK